MDLSHALRILPATSSHPSNIIAFAGAGGKSTAMFQIAREFSPPVIVTATTHLGGWQIPLADQHIIAEDPDDLAGCKFRGVTLVTGPVQEDNRTLDINDEVLEWIHAKSRGSDIPLLIEADGSRQKPLKAPAGHEPVIPDFVDMVIVVAGLAALDLPLTDETVHRAKIFTKLSGLKIGESITPQAIANELTHPDGGLKNIPVTARRIALLNQVDTPQIQAAAQTLTPILLSCFHSIVIASLQEKIVHAVHEPVAGIILAAGESKRYGQPKQLLDWRGEPFILSITRMALATGLSPVIVVTGAHAEQIEKTLKNQAVSIVRNQEWQLGQSTSIHAGIQALPPETGGAIFLLSDQPQITAPVLRALIETHARELHPIVAPLVRSEQRANPVLFDRLTFPDLLTLEGDVGGRAIFSKYRVEYMPWQDDSLLLDVDKPEDYARLKGLE